MATAQILGRTQAGGLVWNVVDTVYIGQVRGVGGNDLTGKVASVEIVTEAQKKSFLAATASGLAGVAIAGPVGGVAGVVAGGNRKEVTFACHLRSGGQFLAKGDVRIFELLLAESMKPVTSTHNPPQNAPKASVPSLGASIFWLTIIFIAFASLTGLGIWAFVTSN